MKLTYAAVGRTREEYLRIGTREYLKRIGKYVPFDFIELPEAKLGGKGTETDAKEKEAQSIRPLISQSDFVVLLDEHGEQVSSRELAALLQQRMNAGNRYLLFVSGGAYGLHPDLFSKANMRMALSRLTFPHQLVRLIFLEQLYRAFSILKGEPYHHDKWSS
jgi:23S rRNA (pseudouridine1915-N3)-methyltransferase